MCLFFLQRKMEEIEEKRRIKSPEKKLTFTTPRPEVLKEQQYFSTIAPKQIVTTRRPTFYDQSLRPQDFGNHKYLPIEQPKPRFSMPIKTATSSPMYDSKSDLSSKVSSKYAFTSPPKITTTTVPTLPPPGGDVPSFMTLLNEVKKVRKEKDEKKENEEFNQEIIQAPPILLKIPVPKSQPNTPPPPAPNNRDPFSVLSNMFVPKWLQDKDSQQKPPTSQVSNMRPKNKAQQSKLPLLPPPRDFPSFEERKKHKSPPPMPLLRRKSPPMRPIQHSPVPSSKFIRKESSPSEPFQRPIQFTPINEGQSIPYHKVNNNALIAECEKTNISSYRKIILGTYHCIRKCAATL